MKKLKPPYIYTCTLCQQKFQKYIDKKMFFPPRCPSCLVKIGVLNPVFLETKKAVTAYGLRSPALIETSLHEREAPDDNEVMRRVN